MKLVPLLRQHHHTFLVPAQSEALEEQRVDLSLQLPGGPSGVDGIGFIEGAGLGPFHTHEQAIVSPG
jgi:hypothetical protein